MDQQLLTMDKVLAGFDAVSQLYPYFPSLCLWRAWEYTAYQHHALPEPVLDIGCGDGRFFKLIWPQLSNVVGLDIDTDIVKIARKSGVYKEVIIAPANQLPVPDQSFASVFANCSLEHMDYLSKVLNDIHRCLCPGGLFLFSVITEKFLEWDPLPQLIERMGDIKKAQALKDEYNDYHHLRNVFPLQVWIEKLKKADFEVLEYIPILPELSSYLFLFIDHLWHVRQSRREIGSTLYPYLTSLDNFPKGFRQIFAGVLQMEQDWSTSSGVIFLTRRQR